MHYLQCKTTACSVQPLTAGNEKGRRSRTFPGCNSCSVISVHAINLSLYTMYTDSSLGGTWSTLQYFGGVQYRSLWFTLCHQTKPPSLHSSLITAFWHWVNSTVTQSCHPVTPCWNVMLLESLQLAGLIILVSFKVPSKQWVVWCGWREEGVGGKVEGHTSRLHCLSFNVLALRQQPQHNLLKLIRHGRKIIQMYLY